MRALILALILAACSQNTSAVPDLPEEAAIVTVTLSEFRVDVDRDPVPAGPVRFVITNAGSIEHNLFLEPVEAIEEPLLDMHGAPAVAEGIHPGETVVLDIDFPVGRQRFQLGCHLPGHYEAGMALVISSRK